MVILVNRKKMLLIAVSLLVILTLTVGCCVYFNQTSAVNAVVDEGNKDFIKWVDFNASYEALDYAIKLDIKNHESNTPMNYIDLLAYITAKNGNNFSKFKTGQLDAVADQIKAGKTMEELSSNLKYYNYYHEAYTATLS
ncbi:MAG: hypothetical protein Q8882_05170 [Bacillota bacterium]|nr:hypothetical protein [Bacillota bacterium]